LVVPQLGHVFVFAVFIVFIFISSLLAPTVVDWLTASFAHLPQVFVCPTLVQSTDLFRTQPVCELDQVVDRALYI